MIKENQLSTDLIGEKTTKTDDKIELLGQLDETSASIMEFYHDIKEQSLKEKLKGIVIVLSKAMAEIAGVGVRVEEIHLTELVHAVDEYNQKAGSFNGFVVPGVTYIGAKAHVVRTVIRRAERAYAKVYENSGGSKIIFEYLNKLSSLFFAVAKFYDEK